MIDSFQGEHAYLSNFYPLDTPVVLNGLDFHTVEAAFQAAKCANRSDQVQFCELSARQAKQLGRQVQLRPGWNEVRLGVMKELVFQKFFNNPELKARLLATGDEELIEGNTWNDRFWGVCGGVGENHLGRILMRVRCELRGNP
jgi:ribA/ribD-fused uncharacterized protein